MSFKPMTRGMMIALLPMLPLAGATASTPDFAASAFHTDMARAMARMDSGMMTKPAGDADQDFVTMMVPHHQGAIDMAIAELQYGRNERLKRIAQEIIIDQQQEIAAMRVALDQPLPLSLPAPTQGGRAVPDKSGKPSKGEQ